MIQFCKQVVVILISLGLNSSCVSAALEMGEARPVAPAWAKLPATLGWVSDYYEPTPGSSAPEFIFVQDLHGNITVQKNLSRILGYLNKEGFLSGAIATEGASGPLALGDLQHLGTEQARRMVAHYMLNQGWIPGDWHYALSHEKQSLVGMESKELYLANLKMYQEAYLAKQQLQSFIQKINHLKLQDRSWFGGSSNNTHSSTDRFEQRLEKMKQLLSGEVTSQEVSSAIQEALQTLDVFESIVSPEEFVALQTALSAMSNFYALAYLRDQSFFKNVIDIKQRNTSSTLVAVMGGFHTQGVTKKLKAENKSYLVLTPKVRSHTASDKKRYQQQMLQSQADDYETWNSFSTEHVLRPLISGRVQRFFRLHVERFSTPHTVSYALVGLGTFGFSVNTFVHRLYDWSRWFADTGSPFLNQFALAPYALGVLPVLVLAYTYQRRISGNVFDDLSHGRSQVYSFGRPAAWFSLFLGAASVFLRPDIEIAVGTFAILAKIVFFALVGLVGSALWSLILRVPSEILIFTYAKLFNKPYYGVGRYEDRTEFYDPTPAPQAPNEIPESVWNSAFAKENSERGKTEDETWDEGNTQYEKARSLVSEIYKEVKRVYSALDVPDEPIQNVSLSVLEFYLRKAPITKTVSKYSSYVDGSYLAEVVTYTYCAFPNPDYLGKVLSELKEQSLISYLHPKREILSFDEDAQVRLNQEVLPLITQQIKPEELPLGVSLSVPEWVSPELELSFWKWAFDVFHQKGYVPRLLNNSAENNPRTKQFSLIAREIQISSKSMVSGLEDLARSQLGVVAVSAQQGAIMPRTDARHEPYGYGFPLKGDDFRNLFLADKITTYDWRRTNSFKKWGVIVQPARMTRPTRMNSKVEAHNPTLSAALNPEQLKNEPGVVLGKWSNPVGDGSSHQYFVTVPQSPIWITKNASGERSPNHFYVSLANNKVSMNALSRSQWVLRDMVHLVSALNRDAKRDNKPLFHVGINGGAATGRSSVTGGASHESFYAHLTDAQLPIFSYNLRNAQLKNVPGSSVQRGRILQTQTILPYGVGVVKGNVRDIDQLIDSLDLFMSFSKLSFNFVFTTHPDGDVLIYIVPRSKTMNENELPIEFGYLESLGVLVVDDPTLAYDLTPEQIVEIAKSEDRAKWVADHHEHLTLRTDLITRYERVLPTVSLHEDTRRILTDWHRELESDSPQIANASPWTNMLPKPIQLMLDVLLYPARLFHEGIHWGVLRLSNQTAQFQWNLSKPYVQVSGQQNMNQYPGAIILAPLMNLAVAFLLAGVALLSYGTPLMIVSIILSSTNLLEAIGSLVSYQTAGEKSDMRLFQEAIRVKLNDPNLLTSTKRVRTDVLMLVDRWLKPEISSQVKQMREQILASA